jgi:alpha-ketoglutarate-dependent taurine dioxygenase
VGRTGWHIDGTFQPAPFSHSLYHSIETPRRGATVFCNLTQVALPGHR